MDAARLKEIQELNRQAALLPSYEANFNATRECLETSEAAFGRLRGERRDLVEAQRNVFDRVMSEVEREFDGRIRARRSDHGVDRPLDAFLRALKQKGITRWWNDLPEDRKPAPEKLAELLDRELNKQRYRRKAFDGSGAPEHPDPETVPDLLEYPLREVGMSDAVQGIFILSRAPGLVPVCPVDGLRGMVEQPGSHPVRKQTQPSDPLPDLGRGTRSPSFLEESGTGGRGVPSCRAEIARGRPGR